ncbi:TolB family protein [Natronoflexus pectinivorans]|uniref:WD40 repeat protein n=1 Tax=Natronoflexus pectinivorans TaxID=682526 RepID=A0A4R2G737_9BACT|nr:TolB family protein [Natronoflexus pectinivorans]TCO03311.1 WD40 repeat protein [Natronoflexus pectinivorans]
MKSAITISILILCFQFALYSQQINNMISYLEIVDIEDSKRTVVYSDTAHFEAPNWSPDGNTLYFNQDGHIYSIPITRGVPTKIEMDFAVNNNNDHVLSPGGTEIAISHHCEDQNWESLIYIVDIHGGIPRKITENGPSYLHGWSPDGKELAFIGLRNDQYDIYTISVNGGEEKQLTNSPSHEDGSDYTPCGKYIWFNSDRSGNMQLWRMRRDGSNPEQMTDDDWVDWFPHPSPDGQWIAFLSYQPGVEGHPANKDVVLRIMPANGGTPHILTELFGGQGTINVPSWSPCSKKFAFVSYKLL